jgi:hypothetical protein
MTRKSGPADIRHPQALFAAGHIIIYHRHATFAFERDRIMTITKSFGLMLVAASTVLGCAGLAHADPPPLTQVLLDFQDVGKAMERLDRERSEAEAERKKARAELDDLKRQNPQAREEAARLERQIEEANEKIRRIEHIVEGKKHDAPHGGPNSDIARELDKLAEEREQAQSDRTRAKEELQRLKEGHSQQREKEEALERQIREDEAKISRADDRLGSIPDRPLEFKTTNDEEIKQALRLPEILKTLISAIGSHRLNDKFAAEPYYDGDHNVGGIKIHWKGNP